MDEIIKIVYADIETPLELSSEYTNLLILENPKEFYKTVNILRNEFNGEEDDYIFLKNDTPVKPENVGYMVSDIFNFDINDKKILTLLYKKLQKLCMQGQFYSEFNEINTKLFELYKNIFHELSFTLTYDEIPFESLLKGTSVRFETDYHSLLEKIICFINVLIELKSYQFIIFVNLKSVLNDEELQLLYHHCSLEKIGLLLVESSKIRPLLPTEKAIIITEDLCEILENYDLVC